MLPRIAAPLTARPATRADAAEILGVVAASEAALDGTSEIHEADIRQMSKDRRGDRGSGVPVSIARWYSSKFRLSLVCG